LKEHGVDFLLDLATFDSNARSAISADSCGGHSRGARVYGRQGYTLTDRPCSGRRLARTSTFSSELHHDQKVSDAERAVYIEATAMALARCILGPTSRGEIETRRHLTEFWMLEPEAALRAMDEAMELARDWSPHRAVRVKGKPPSGTAERDATKLENVNPSRASAMRCDRRFAEKRKSRQVRRRFRGDEETIISKDSTPVLIHHYRRR